MFLNGTTIDTCCHKKDKFAQELDQSKLFKQGKWLLYFDPYQFDWHQ